MVVVGQPVTEKSVLKLEARLQALQFQMTTEQHFTSELENLVRDEMQKHRSYLLRLAEALEDHDVSKRTIFFPSHSHAPSEGQLHSPSFWA